VIIGVCNTTDKMFSYKTLKLIVFYSSSTPPLDVSVTPKCLWRVGVVNKVSFHVIILGHELKLYKSTILGKFITNFNKFYIFKHCNPM
jgi:Rps23 Pro-64 3,4-dihydroxylase Tpa1-like proline 4-hydroxylase